MGPNEWRNLVPLALDGSEIGTIMDIKIVTSKEGDWQGLYLNDVLAEEGHKLSLTDVLDLIGVEFTQHVFNGDDNLPDHFEDLEQ